MNLLVYIYIFQTLLHL